MEGTVDVDTIDSDDRTVSIGVDDVAPDSDCLRCIPAVGPALEIPFLVGPNGVCPSSVGDCTVLQYRRGHVGEIVRHRIR